MRNGENPCCASCQEASLTLASAPCRVGKRRGCRRGWVRLLYGPKVTAAGALPAKCKPTNALPKVASPPLWLWRERPATLP